MLLGLFPLNLVLFPQSQVPLHIFEPRYRALISECMTEGKVFGVNLVEQGHLYPIGCAARVTSLTQQYEDGRMDVMVEGVQRFRLLGVKEDDAPYVVGEVEFLDDEDAPVDTNLIARCADLYNQIVELVYGTSARLFDTKGTSTSAPSFYMAPKSGLNTDQKQHLIEMDSENARLEYLYDHLAEIVPTVRQAELVQRVIASDGYFPPTA